MRDRDAENAWDARGSWPWTTSCLPAGVSHFVGRSRNGFVATTRGGHIASVLRSDIPRGTRLNGSIGPARIEAVRLARLDTSEARIPRTLPRRTRSEGRLSAGWRR